MTHIDTHVAVWLAQGEVDQLSRAARRAVSAGEVVLSPIVVLELQLLHEIGRLEPNGPELARMLSEEAGIELADSNYTSVVMEAAAESWTRDPFDRLIVAHAKADRARLVTKDERLQRHYSGCIW